GANKVHFVVSSAPIYFPDFYGIDLAQQNQIIAAYKSVDEICKLIGADSLVYLPYKEMIDSIGVPEEQLHTGCFTGDYVIDLGSRWGEVDLKIKDNLKLRN
ncbi:MAG: amidophosphoribosyltransferase, partial [bacterium]|nr:amidophosphoribosyltransferase [bacterium]